MDQINEGKEGAEMISPSPGTGATTPCQIQLEKVLAIAKKRMLNPRDGHDLFDAVLTFARLASRDKNLRCVIVRLHGRRYGIKALAEMAYAKILALSLDLLKKKLTRAEPLGASGDANASQRQIEVEQLSLLYYAEATSTWPNDPRVKEVTDLLMKDGQDLKRIAEKLITMLDSFDANVGIVPSGSGSNTPAAALADGTHSVIHEDCGAPRHALDDPATRSRILRLGQKCDLVDSAFNKHLDVLRADSSVGVSWVCMAESLRTYQSVWLNVTPAKSSRQEPIEHRDGRGFRYSKQMCLDQAELDSTFLAERALRQSATASVSVSDLYLPAA